MNPIYEVIASVCIALTSLPASLVSVNMQEHDFNLIVHKSQYGWEIITKDLQIRSTSYAKVVSVYCTSNLIMDAEEDEKVEM